MNSWSGFRELHTPYHFVSVVVTVILGCPFVLAQPNYDIFVRLGNVHANNALVKGDTIFIVGSVAETSFPIVYGNRDTYGYDVSNAFIVYSDADGIPGDGTAGSRGTGSAQWGFSTPNGGNYAFPSPPNPLVNGLWIDTTGYFSKADFGSLYRLNSFGCDGAGADTVAFIGIVKYHTESGLRAGDSGVNFVIRVQARIVDTGQWICIDSSTYYPPPDNNWKWVCFKCISEHYQWSVRPTWGGARCFIIKKYTGTYYSVANCPGTLSGAAGSLYYDLNIIGSIQSDARWSIVSGVGSINPSTGIYTTPGVNPGSYQVIVGVTNVAGTMPTMTCQLSLTVAAAPTLTISCPGGAPIIGEGDTKSQTITATGGSGPITYFISSGNLTGATIDPNNGVLTYTGNFLDFPLACGTIGAVSGIDTAFCDVCWHVIGGCSYKLTIEKKHDVLQGAFTNVDLFLTRANEGLGGFDLLIAYDNSALSFQSASPGAIYDSCKWEYFTYRIGSSGNCSSGCPSGLVRVVGIAETNNGPAHPTCGWPDFTGGLPTTLASLQFLVSNDRTLECQFVPIRFFWEDCGDNTLSSADGARLFTNCKVFDYENENPINDPSFGFPGFFGSTNDCITSTPKQSVERNIDFQNGGVDIICADSIDARGDINLNGTAYEIADAVMFSNYFISGLAAFAGHIPGSQAASDINSDGISLTVSDLVYLIRVIVGDAQAYPKPAVSTVSVSTSNGLWVDENIELGAVFLVLSGNVAPVMVANARMEYAFDGANTRVLIHAPFDLSQSAIGKIQGFSGQLLSNDQIDVVQIELADVHGDRLDPLIPASVALLQNYPNPFNPTTTISFELPAAGDYKVSVFNVAGQKVKEISGHASGAGRVALQLDMLGFASGIYMYKLEADQFTATRKAVLLK